MAGVVYYYDEDSRTEFVLARDTARVYPRHVHVENRVKGRVLSGAVILETPDGTRVLGEGDRFEIPAGTVHALEILPGGSLTTECSPDADPFLVAEPCVRAVAAKILERPDEPFTLEAMAALAGYSQWHFCRMFRKATGLAPHAFQLACKVRLARRLLRSGKTAAEAAVLAGFADQSHMHKAFALHHGMTPRQFMKRSVLLRP
ncbi:MAG: AraC family transcriptional regulator [Deltaproteobacteria bacterium]|nr:AraC family transcriptional regulator [Deltaproteobacteria bacterium]